MIQAPTMRWWAVLGDTHPEVGTLLIELAEVPAGATISLQAEARLVLVYFADGAEYSFVGPAQLTVAATAPSSLSGAPPSTRNVLHTGGRAVRISPAGKAQASVDMRDAGPAAEITLLRPAPGSFILDQRPVFAWHPVTTATRYRFELIDEDLSTVIETTLEAQSLELPADLSLLPGGIYTCHLETRLADSTPLSTWAVFTVASAEQQRLEAEMRPDAEASFSERLVFALWLRQNLFADEARRLWTALREQRQQLGDFDSLE